ncbi:hypothetical protein [Acaricomes phytoseiuli]|uniref:hypothetical protein n=1 Tax=Acaricomes phytoseiuli TaxID=291968 RepID=UPI0003770841|nr:hypothetical protein [Acaricomes phytoseiuli]
MKEILEGLAGFVVDKAVKPLFDAIFNSLAQFLAGVLKWASTFWVGVDAPNLTSGAGAPVVAFLESKVSWVAAVLLVVSVLIAGIQIMTTRSGQPLGSLVKHLVTFLVVTGAGVSAVGLLTVFSDSLSKWVVADAGGELNEGLTAVLVNPALGSGLGAVIMVLLGIAASVVQCMLMLVRSGMIVIMAGLLPLVVAFTNTQTGKTWFSRYVSILVTFIIWKPVAALIYAAGLQLMGSRAFGADLSVKQDLGEAIAAGITGLVIMGMAVIALPSLLKLLSPALAAVGGGALGGAIGASASMMSVPASGATKTPTAGGGARGGAAQSGATSTAGASGASTAGSTAASVAAGTVTAGAGTAGAVAAKTVADKTKAGAETAANPSGAGEGHSAPGAAPAQATGADSGASPGSTSTGAGAETAAHPTTAGASGATGSPGTGGGNAGASTAAPRSGSASNSVGSSVASGAGEGRRVAAVAAKGVAVGVSAAQNSIREETGEA